MEPVTPPFPSWSAATHSLLVNAQSPQTAPASLQEELPPSPTSVTAGLLVNHSVFVSIPADLSSAPLKLQKNA